MHKTWCTQSRSSVVAYLALWKVADADFPIAPNPTPTARPSEIGRKKTVRSNPTTAVGLSLLLRSNGAKTGVSRKAGLRAGSLPFSF